MANEPRSKPPKRSVPGSPGRPDIWAQGGQRPKLDLRSMGRASLHLSRIGVAVPLAWAARKTRRVAVNIKNGAGRIPEAKLGRVAPYVPSHLRVAAWIKTGAAILAHASASADPDVKRGNALVAEIEPHLWEVGAAPVVAPPAEPEPAKPAPPKPAPTESAPPEPQPDPAPVVLPEPEARPYDPLASIRAEIDRKQAQAPAVQVRALSGPQVPPLPPGPVATMAIQIIGYGIGWASTFVALPYGLIRSLWAYAKGQDLRKIGREE
jgi:hypothetical protein